MVQYTTVDNLARKIVNNEDVFILDIRNEDAFNNWKIEGKYVHIVNEPYLNLLDDIEPIRDRLNKADEIIVVCAKGSSSKKIVEMLLDAGYENAYTLKGGMGSWSEHLEPVKIADLKDGGQLYQFVRLGKGCLSYMIVSDGEAAIIDPARMTEAYVDFAAEQGVDIKHVLDTHLHADHISGGRKLSDQTGAAYYLPPKDAIEVEYIYTPIKESDIIKVGKTTISVQAIYTPGHTIGSTSYIVDNAYLLTGDILFTRSIGRPDLAGKAEDWVDDLHDTLYGRYKKLSQDLIVLPAHYSFPEELKNGGKVWARLGDLYAENAGLQVNDRSEFREMVTKNLPPQPNKHQAIREANMGKLSPGLDEQKEMETGPNRCAVEA